MVQLTFNNTMVYKYPPKGKSKNKKNVIEWQVKKFEENELL